MVTLQVSFVNRRGQTLRGLVNLPDGAGKFPAMLLLHGFMGSAAGYKGLNIRIARDLAEKGIACARFDFHGNGESDGEFEDMTFSGLYEDTQDMFAWMAAQSWADPERLFLSGQSMGGYVAASCAPLLNPRGLLLLCPGAGMWYGCAQRADAVTQSGRSWFDMEGLRYEMAFNYDMASHPDPYEEAQGYSGPVFLTRAADDQIVDEGACLRYARLYQNPQLLTTESGGHNFTSVPVRKALTEAMASFIRTHC